MIKITRKNFSWELLKNAGLSDEYIKRLKELLSKREKAHYEIINSLPNLKNADDLEREFKEKTSYNEYLERKIFEINQEIKRVHKEKT